MRGHRGASGLAFAVAVSLVVSLPLLTGQGCPGDSSVIPIKPGVPGNTGGLDGNVPPSFRFTAPVGAVQAEIGDSVQLAWTDSDPDNNAQITILLDPDTIPNNGNEIPIATGISEDDLTNTLTINTGAHGLTTGSYRIIARVTDGINPELLVAATGQLDLFTPGMTPGNVSPTVVVTAPSRSISASQGTPVTVTYCGNDRDGGQGGVVADVLILLDQDTDPLNDLFSQVDHTSPEGAALLTQICASQMPLAIDGAVVLGCAKDPKCTNSNNGTNFPFTVDATRIPQPPGGDPYRVRVSMWDHTNPPVHAYSSGTLSLTGLATGTVDLAQVGRTLSGARFIGFDSGARAGFTGTNLGDFDGDGADDFIVVARWGRPFERGNVGSAYLVYGLQGERFGGDIYLNSYGQEYRGCGFASGHAGPYYMYSYYYGGPTQITSVTEGIVAVSSIEDLTGDGKPEILFGLPYAEGWYDYHDDDPCDEKERCYNDGMPNPLMTDDPDNDDITPWDYREGIAKETINDVEYTYDCTNDGDFFAATPINQGYVVYLSSNNVMEDTILDISMAGQKDPDEVILEEGTEVSGSSNPTGARLRGGWFSSGTTSTGIDSFNQFGRVLGTMPDMSNGGSVPRRDGRSEFLISLPTSYGNRGSIRLTWGQDLASFCAQPVQSIPDYRRTEGDPCYRVRYFPDGRSISGARPGDEFGYANRAGDVNRDGHPDILCGAPGADHGGVVDAGTVYVIYGRLDFGHVDLSTATDPTNPNKQYVPRVELHGTNTGDRFGEVQIELGDVNSDGFGDFAFSSKLADGPGGVDSGYIGVVFGRASLTGESVFYVNQVGTPQLPGCVFYGSQRGGHAGATIANIGDFNGDGFDDLAITAPNEVRSVNGQNRRGVAYIVFGGPHLANNPVRNFFMLDQVGTAELPGIVIVSPYAQGTADEATVDWIGAAGDVDGDGFQDIIVGVSEADFVNPLDPGQRRIDAGEAYLIYGNNSGGNILR